MEAVHKSDGQVFRTLIHLDSPQAEALVVRRALVTAMHGTRCTANRSLCNLSPGAVAFRRDIVFGYSVPSRKSSHDNKSG